MKTLSFIFLAAFFCLTAFAQDLSQNRRMITVQGTAEMEYTPDQFEVLVTLQEYESRGTKRDINAIKNDFLQRMIKAGIIEKDITVYNLSGTDAIDRFWSRKTKNKDQALRASINYLIKLKSIDEVNKLADNLDDEATTNFNILKADHSRIEEFKNQLRLQALENAKQKAVIYASKLGEQVGEALQVNEPYEQHMGYYAGEGAMRMREMAVSAPMQESTRVAQAMQVNFRKLKLRFDSHVVFALK
jgi:uncharacterized protein